MIDLIKETKTYSLSELKARSMSRTQEQLGYEESYAALWRAVAALRGQYTLDATRDAQINGIVNLLISEETEYDKEKVDNDKMKLVLEYEAAEKRLAEVPLDPTAVDSNGNLLYPKVDDGNGNLIENPKITKDKAERTNAQTVITNATTETTTIANDRATYRASLNV